MYSHQYYDDPSVPGCCCSMPGGARVVGIIEIVFSVLWLIGGIYQTATGNFYYISQIAIAVIMLIAAVMLMQGARMRCSGKFLFYMVAKPIILAFEIAALIYSGVEGKRAWNNATRNKGWTPDERQTADSIFYGIWGFALAFAAFYVVVGLINVYVVIQCYRHLKANPPVPMAPPTVTYAYGQAPPTGVVVTGMPPPQYGQQPYAQQPYGQQAPPYYGQQQGMQNAATFEK